MYNRVNSFITEHDLLCNEQFGFRKQHSTDMAALKFINDVTSALDNKCDTVSIFIDLSTAFDTI